MKAVWLEFETFRGPQRLTVMLAATALSRMRGLLGRPALQRNEGLLLRPCNLIHTLGMRYPIDVVFLRRDGLVLKVAASLPARRASGHVRAQCVLELATGVAEHCGIVAGARLPIGALQ